jgi:hypothetical protein
VETEEDVNEDEKRFYILHREVERAVKKMIDKKERMMCLEMY